MQSASPVIPSVFNVQSDVFFKYGVPAGEEKHLSDIQECLLSDSMYVLRYAALKIHHVPCREVHVASGQVDYLTHHIVSD